MPLIPPPLYHQDFALYALSVIKTTFYFSYNTAENSVKPLDLAQSFLVI